MRRLSLIFCLLLIFRTLFSQELKKVEWSIGVKPFHAWLWAHDKKIKHIAGTTGTGFQIDINRVRLDETAYNYNHIKYNSGFTIQGIAFHNPIIGNALNLAYFMEPFLIDRKNFSLRLRAAGGVNFADKPYNEFSNPMNKVYSTYVNGYIGLGVSAHIKLGDKIAIFGDATYSHFSNGNTQNPNFGANYPNIGLGVDYLIKTTEKPIGKMYFYPEKWRFDILIFGSTKSLPTRIYDRFWVYGGGAQIAYRSSTLHAWSLGIEGLTDKGMRTAMDSSALYYGKNISDKLGGILIGHEYLFNRCIFSQQIGYYFYKKIPGELVGPIYHRWGIYYKLNKYFKLGLNLNVDIQKAFVFDARIVYSFYH